MNGSPQNSPAPLLFRHGVDIVEIHRIARMIEVHEQRFLDRCFTPSERDYCIFEGKHLIERFAARFAAKEAAMKALGTGWSHGIAWTDIEVLRSVNGQPTLSFTGRAAEIAHQQGLTRWALSLSHTDTVAIASVIAWH